MSPRQPALLPAASSTQYLPKGKYVGYYKLAQGGLLALAPDGQLRWSFNAGAGISASPAVDDSGNIYVAQMTTAGFQALGSSGSNLWSFPLSVSGTSSSAAVSPGGTLYFGSGTTLYAVVGGHPPARSSWPMFRGGPLHTARTLQRGIQCSAPLPDGSLDLRMQTEDGASYQILYSTNLFDWSALIDFKATNCNSILNLRPPSRPWEFFRLRSSTN
jgi:hypothetical protein